MKPLLIVNDVHISTTRVAGTTPASASELKAYLQDSFRDMIMAHKDKDLFILGDLFDGFTVESREMLELYNTLTIWLLASGGKIMAAPGNHDFSAKGDKLSSFHFLFSVLESQFGSKVVVYESEFSEVSGNLYVVPHCLNQSLFDLELDKALAAEPGTLMLHCNVMSPFASADHSLNLTPEYAEKLTAKHKLIVAHEHQSRFLSMGEGITVLGNQYPSSVADCLGNDKKFAHVIDGDGVLTRIETTDVQAVFTKVDWQNLASVADQKFIRVGGNATASQAADVITAIAKFRSKSSAYVVSNAVSVEGVNNMNEMTETSLEQIQAFNVLGALMELLDPREQKTITEVLND